MGLTDEVLPARAVGSPSFPPVIHVSQILTFPPVRALATTMMDVQRAVKLRNSHIIKVRVSPPPVVGR